MALNIISFSLNAAFLIQCFVIMQKQVSYDKKLA